jgi:hypothetical protein
MEIGRTCREACQYVNIMLIRRRAFTGRGSYMCIVDDTGRFLSEVVAPGEPHSAFAALETSK